MIILTKLDGTEFVINCELIEMVEHTPDTIVRLRDKKYFIVRENLNQIVEKVIEYKRYCNEKAFINIMDTDNEMKLEDIEDIEIINDIEVIDE